MIRHNFFKWCIFALAVVLSEAIPSSLVEEIKATELTGNKVKRGPLPISNRESARQVSIPFYNKPTAIKRGTEPKNSASEPTENDWESNSEQGIFQNAENTPLSQSGFYNTGDNNPFDEKTLNDYEKGFQYGTNKDNLDEALENAVLKSELYGDSPTTNQYRYFENRNRKRRAAKKARIERLKREVDLTPEEILTLLALYENEHKPTYKNYRPVNWQKFEKALEKDDTQDDENWLDTPVYPHADRNIGSIDTNYIYDQPALELYSKKPRWNGFSEKRNKRFMVARKRADPSRELRYLNGPSKNDYYTLIQLLNSERDPSVPLYHRYVL